MFYETNFVRHTISNEEIEQLRAAGFGHIADKLGVLNEKYTEIQKANVHAELVKSDVLKENELKEIEKDKKILEILEEL